MNDEELKALLAKASPRPWRYDGRDVFSAELINESGLVLPIPETWHPSQRVNEADIRLLVEAVNRLSEQFE